MIASAPPVAKYRAKGSNDIQLQHAPWTCNVVICDKLGKLLTIKFPFPVVIQNRLPDGLHDIPFT